MRTLRLVGVIRNARLLTVARRCSWCRRFISFADMAAAYKHGARVKDGCMCNLCAARFLAEAERIPAKGEV